MNMTVTPTQTGVRVSIPMKVRKPRGKTQILLPDTHRPVEREQRKDYPEAIAVAIARGHLWCEMLQSGRFSSLREMAARFGLRESYMARLCAMGRSPVAPRSLQSPRGESLARHPPLVDSIPLYWRYHHRQAQRSPGLVLTSILGSLEPISKLAIPEPIPLAPLAHRKPTRAIIRHTSLPHSPALCMRHYTSSKIHLFG